MKPVKKTRVKYECKQDEEVSVCSVCYETINECSAECDLCDGLVHSHCSGIDTVALKNTVRYYPPYWVGICLNCRDDHRHKVAQLQSAVARMTDQLADVLAKMTMYDDVLQCSNMKGCLLYTSPSPRD